ncbi:MAG: hypothetical protein ACLPVI_09050 [Dehalococcoidales bacterium]
MQKILQSMRTRLKKANEQDRKLEKPIEKFSRLIWPWSESRLIQFVSLLAVLDYSSTFAALKFNSSHQVSELGLMAKWALNTGGFTELLVIDAAVIAAFILIAVGVRALYTRFGFPGYGRAAFVFIFIPYAIIMLPIIFNNIISTFR